MARGKWLNHVACLAGLFALAQSTAAHAAEAAAKPAAEPPAAPEAAPVAAPAPAAAPVETPAVATPAPVAAPAAPAPTDYAPLKLESANASIKFGFLAQPQFEASGNQNPATNGASYNLFIRRTRLLIGGSLFGKFEYFFDTDSPNLFKAGDTGAKAAPGIGVQDAFITYKAYEDMFKIDAGYMLPAGAHNALQGAGTLYGLDYFANSFRHQGVFNSAGDVGRDVGVQARGLLADGLVEYRLGVFQGLREPATMTTAAAHKFFRVAGRVQVNLLDPETGFFYAGSYLGKKKVVSVGASYDFQSGYHHWGLDGFADLPLGPGALTAQINVAKWNGNSFIAALPKQTAVMAEAGYRFDGLEVAPILRVESRKVTPAIATAPDEFRYSAGIAYFPFAHNVNLKAFYSRVAPKPGLKDYSAFNLQWQLYFF